MRVSDFRRKANNESNKINSFSDAHCYTRNYNSVINSIR